MLKLSQALLVVAALGSVLSVWIGSAAQPAPAVDEVAVDVDVAGNGANSLGPTEFCNATPLAVGATFDVDVVVRGVPADPRFFGIGLQLLFDPAVLRVDKVHTEEEPSFMAGETLVRVIDYDAGGDVNGPPGTTGNTRVDWVQTITHNPAESGDGVLVRVTMTAVGNGTSLISPRGYSPGAGPTGPPEVLWVEEGAAGVYYDIGVVNDGVVVVGSGSCPGAPPASVFTPTPTPSDYVAVPTTLAPPTNAPSSTVTTSTTSPSPRTALPTTRGGATRTSMPAGAVDESDGGGSSWWLWAVLVVVLAAVAGAVGWYAVTRARQASR